MELLNCLPPTLEPRATDHVQAGGCMGPLLRDHTRLSMHTSQGASCLA